MQISTLARRTGLAAAAVSLPLVLAACGSSQAASDSSPMTSSPMTSSPMTSSTPAPMMSDEATSSNEAMPFGPGCAAVPADGKGSFAGMATDPVATAASNNPALSTLVTAVTEAGLGDSFNSADGITVLAPVNDAFAALDKATLDAALADPSGLLTTVLTYHVIGERLAPEELAGTHETLQGGTVRVTGSGEDFTVNGEAMVVCGNVQTANATVYLIDGVLLPS